MPAAASACASSPPRPNTNGSPPLRRTTLRPARPRSPSRLSISSWLIECPPGRLPTGRRSGLPTSRGQLEVSAAARHREEDAVVALVPAEAADLGEADAVAVERHDLVEALGVAGDAKLHELS